MGVEQRANEEQMGSEVETLPEPTLYNSEVLPLIQRYGHIFPVPRMVIPWIRWDEKLLILYSFQQARP